MKEGRKNMKKDGRKNMKEGRKNIKLKEERKEGRLWRKEGNIQEEEHEGRGEVDRILLRPLPIAADVAAATYNPMEILNLERQWLDACSTWFSPGMFLGSVVFLWGPISILAKGLK